MKVMITGCNGQVGHCLSERLHARAEVLAVNHQQLDITDQEAVLSLVTEFQPDYIFNAAAHTSVDKAEEEVDTSFLINRDGPSYLAEAAQLCGAVMLHISTDYVFDGQGNHAYKESDVVGPQNVYGRSKLAGEVAVSKVCSKCLILRTSWVFGEHGNNFVKTMLSLAKDHDELSIVGDQVGGPTYAGDIADALIHIVNYIEEGNQVEWGVYHFSGLPYVSWFEFAEQIFAVAEQKQVIFKKPRLSSIPTSAYPTPAKRPENSRMDCSKIESQFGIQPSDWLNAITNIQAYK